MPNLAHTGLPICDVAEGDIMKAKPKHFIPRPEGVGSVGQHPVVVLSRPDAAGYVLVTPMSHNHPDGTPTKNASRYGLPVDPVKGESRVNVGVPKLIHQDNLKANNPYVRMHQGNFLSLKTDILNNLQHCLAPRPYRDTPSIGGAYCLFKYS